MKKVLLALTILLSVGATSQPKRVTEAEVREALYPLAEADVEAMRAMGPQVLPHLVKLYAAAPTPDRAVIAWVFYSLGWKSDEAKAVLMEDVHTSDEKLRLQVQWALGRVSDDADVVETLADIMRNDRNALFRDKAACALAYDQIHLTERQKVELYEKLIDGLGDSKPQVRSISILALSIHTGQTKGFEAGAPDADRARAIEAWKRWLEEYEAQLR